MNDTSCSNESYFLDFEVDIIRKKTSDFSLLSVKTEKHRTSFTAQFDQSLLCAQWVAKDPVFLHADSEHSDQTDRWTNTMFIERPLSTGLAMC